MSAQKNGVEPIPVFFVEEARRPVTVVGTPQVFPLTSAPQMILQATTRRKRCVVSVVGNGVVAFGNNAGTMASAVPGSAAQGALFQGPCSFELQSTNQWYAMQIPQASDTPQESSGSQVAPAGNTIITQLTGLPAGTYLVNWTVGLQGAAAAADANNFKISNTGVQISTAVNPGAAGEYPQPQLEVVIPANGSLLIQAVGAGTAGVTYSATLAIEPVSVLAPTYVSVIPETEVDV